MSFHKALTEVASYFDKATALLSLAALSQTLVISWLARKIVKFHKENKSFKLDHPSNTLLKAIIANTDDAWALWHQETSALVCSPQFNACLQNKQTEPIETLEQLINAIRDHDPNFSVEIPSHGAEEALIERTFHLSSGETLTLVMRSLNKEGYNVCLLWLRRPLSLNHAQLTSPFYDHILNALPYPVWLRDPNGQLVYHNKAYGEALETPHENSFKVDALLWQEGGSINDDLRHASPRSCKNYAVIKGVRHLLEFHETEPNDEGYRIGYTKDLTHSAELQADLDRHITAHRLVLEQLSAGIIMFGGDKRVKFFNHAYVRLFNMDENWLHTQPLLSEVLESLRSRRLLPEQADFSAYKKRLQGMFTDLSSPLHELMHLPDERTIRLVTSPHPMGGLFFLYEDVTDSLILERQANTQMAVLKETLDNLYEAVAVFTSDNRLKLCNPAFGRLWRLPKELLTTNCHIADLVENMRNYFDAGDNWESYKLGIIGHLTDRIPKSGRLKRDDDSVLEFSYVPLPDGAHFVSYTNVTDSYRVERALRERNQALEAADQLKTEFIDNMSHELKAPLNTIVGFTEILSNQYLGHLNSEQKAYTKGILEASQHLLMLVNDIIDLATIEAGHMELNLKSVDIKALLDSVVDLVRKRAKSQRIKLTLNCAKDMPAVVVDERRLKQALFNLVNNALKHTTAGGRITVSASINENTLTLAVSESGAGFGIQEQEPIFKSLEKQDTNIELASTSNLGLSLVKSLIELHGGNVMVESNPKMGSKVICSIPLDLVQSPQSELLRTG